MSDEIVCPHCGYEFSDSWEYHDTQDEQKVECLNEECSKTFSLFVEFDVTYKTIK